MKQYPNTESDATEPAPDAGHDFEECKAFLELLAPEPDAELHFRAFYDRKPKKGAFKWAGTPDKVWDQCVAHNKATRGVYVVVNAGGQTKAKITHVRALFADFDEGPPSREPALPPSIIIQSSPGKLHYYWLTAAPEEITLFEFSRFQDAIASEYGADKACKDLPRVLRLPGLYHLKGEPHLVRKIGGNGARYTRAQLETLIDNRDTTPAQPDQPTSRNQSQVAETAFEPPRHIVEDALNHLSADECDPYMDWLQVGMTLHHWSQGHFDAWEIWDRWSAQSNRYDDDKTDEKWKSFGGKKQGRPKTINTLFAYARKHGWDDKEYVAWLHSRDQERNSWNSVDWPIVSGKQRTPAPNDERNVRALLNHLDVHLYANTFSNTFHIEGFKRYDELDDAPRDDLWAKAQALGLKAGRGDFNILLEVIARADERHPVRESFNRLQAEWDRISRIDTWLHRYLGAEDSPLNRAIGRIWLTALVRRVRRPGCQFDTMPVLEGPENLGKSSALRILAGGADLFTDCVRLGLGAKEMIEQTKGKILCEIAEMDTLQGSNGEARKAQITRRADIARLSYRRETTEVPRQFILCGTTNDDRYLQDTTGNRRYLPIRIINSINLDALKRDRDQLIGEAAHLEADGEPTELPLELHVEATLLQNSRVLKHPIHERLEDLLGGWECGRVLAADLRKAVTVPGQVLPPDHYKIIARAMASAGWSSKKIRTPLRSTRQGYEKIDTPAYGGIPMPSPLLWWTGSKFRIASSDAAEWAGRDI